MIYSGTLSYSIYMIHTFVWARVKNVAQVSDAVLETGFYEGKYIGQTLLQGDVFVLIGLCLTVIGSILTYKFVERPCQALGKRWMVGRQRATT